MSPEWIALLTVSIAFLGSIVGLVTRLNQKVDEVHVMVNDRMTEALNRIDQLTEALAASGVEIPDSPRRHGDDV